MADKPYWFRRVAHRYKQRYVPTCWQGVAAIAAVPLLTLALVGALSALHPLIGMIAFPAILLAAMSVLFTTVAARSEPE